MQRGNVPRDDKRKPRGVFEKVPGTGIFWIQYFDAAGKRRREMAGSKSNAIRLRDKRKTEALQGKKLPETLRTKAITFRELAKDAMEYSVATKASFIDDQVRMKKLLTWLGDIPAESLSPQEIERWLSTKAAELKPATLNRYRSLLSLAYRLGMQNGKVQTNPARLVRQRREDNARIRYLEAKEEQALRAVIQADHLGHEPELDVALYCGLRRSEQYSLTWDYVDFERKLLFVRRSKNGGARHIPLNSAAISALRTLRMYGNGSRWVFPGRTGKHVMSPRSWFEAAVQRAGMKDFTWHCLRHTFASRLVMAGVDLRTVQELMGHKTIQMTCRYAHLAPQHNLAAVEKLCDAQNQPTATTTATEPNTPPEASTVVYSQTTGAPVVM